MKNNSALYRICFKEILLSKESDCLLDSKSIYGHLIETQAASGVPNHTHSNE